MPYACGALRSKEIFISDLEIVLKIRKGHYALYAELMRRHYPKIFCLCLSLLRDRSLAEDASQEAFLKAYRSLDQYREDSSFSTWIHRIAVNCCLDGVRLKAREKEDSLDAMLENSARRSAQELESFLHIESSLIDADLVEKIMVRLPTEYRLILILREVQGLNYQEIAQVLECSLDSVKARLRRARLSCGEILRHFQMAGYV